MSSAAAVGAAPPEQGPPDRSTQAVPAVPERPAGGPKEPELLPGDPAPALAIPRWLKGSALEAADRSTIRVIALLDPASPTTGPLIGHLGRLEERLEPVAKDRLRIIAILSEPRASDRSTPAPLDRESQEKQLESLAALSGPARVGVDAGRQFAAHSFDAAGVPQLPVAFIYDQADRLSWIGDPQDAGNITDALLMGERDASIDRAAWLAAWKGRHAATRLLAERTAALGSGNRDAVREATEQLATLDIAWVPTHPGWLARVERVRDLVDAGRIDDAVSAAGESVSDPRMASDPEFLLALAKELRAVAPDHANEYGYVAQATFRAQGRRDRRSSDDPWLIYQRGERRKDQPRLLALLAEDRFDNGQPAAAADLAREAADAASAVRDEPAAARLRERAALFAAAAAAAGSPAPKSAGPDSSAEDRSEEPSDPK